MPTILRSDLPIPGLYDTAFGGIFSRVGTSEIAHFGLMLSWLTALVCAAVYTQTGNRKLARASYAATVMAFLVSCFLIHAPWDELFVNLRHSFHFAQGKGFSFNATQPIEATVDFLFYFVVGLAMKLGVPGFEFAIILSVLGGIGLLFCGFQIARLSNPDKQVSPFYFFLLSLFPPLLLNSPQGFSTTVFSALIIGSLIGMIFAPQSLGWKVLLALIPLVRAEGIWWVALLWTAHIPKSASISKWLRSAFLIALPFGLLSIWRQLTFDTVIPTPITYKSSLGDLHYLKIGIRNFMRDFSLSLALPSLAVVVAYRFQPKFKLPIPAKYLRLVFWFILPYYLSGGDWFPPTWARYLLPLSFLLFAVAMSSIFQDLKNTVPVFLILLALVTIYFPWTLPFDSLRDNLFEEGSGRGNLRVQRLSQIGAVFSKSLQPTDVIASSEVATIMYFANREALSLLGAANPEIAKAPLIKTYNITFRRKKPEIIARERPAVVWPYDYTHFGSRSEDSDQKVLETLSQRHSRYDSSNNSIFGGRDLLKKLGYREVVLLAPEFSTYYLVSSERFSDHLSALKSIGFTQASRSP